MSTKCKTFCKALRENKDEDISKCRRVFLRRETEITVQIIRIQSSIINTPDIRVYICLKSLNSVHAFCNFQFR